MSKKVAMVHTTLKALEAVKNHPQELEEFDVLHLLDDGLLRDLNAQGALTPALIRRFCGLVAAAGESGPDVILVTCSSYSTCVEIAQKIVSVPVLAADGAMIDKIIANDWPRIMAVATVQGTIQPALTQLKKAADLAGKEIAVNYRVVPQAFEALKRGDRQRHDQLILEALSDIQATDVIMLCQFTMAHLEQKVMEQTGLNAVSSLSAALQKVREVTQ